jgi:hypothetical protein
MQWHRIHQVDPISPFREPSGVSSRPATDIGDIARGIREISFEQHLGAGEF